MLSLDRWREIWDTLVQNKLRTVLTMVAMSWGIFMLVALLGLGKGLQNGVTSGFASDAVDSMYIWGGETSVAHQGMPIGRRITFDNRDLPRVGRDPGVEHLTARHWLNGDGRVRVGEKTNTFDIRAVLPGHVYLEKIIVQSGRFLNEADLDQRRKVAVIGLPVADFLYGRRDVVGEWLEINRVSFQVVGVFDDEGSEDEKRKVYIPMSTAQLAYNGGEKVNAIMVTIGDAGVDESHEITDRVRAMLGESHHFDPTDPKAIRVRNNVENYDKFMKIFSMIDIFIWLVGACTIVAGIVGVSNIMMIIVRERTREIGIRKALGATPWNVVSTILQEAVVLTAAAGYLGLLAGVGVLELLSKFMPANEMFKDPEVDLGVALAATAVLVAAGALAGFFPARAAARVNPIVALRDD